MSDRPPVPKYRLTVEVRGNSHAEIAHELHLLANGGYLLSSDYYKRDEFRSIGGTITQTLEHANPEMTPARYEAELDEWFKSR